LGSHEIISPIGAGGMGEVYRARDTILKRDVALKVLPDAFANDADRMARFQREAEVLASLNHPNIAQIYAVQEQAIVMEMVEGDTLHGPLPLDVALIYARQIANALEAAHERGIIHRDLKPANIMITPDDVVKVLDFGLAQMAAASTASGNPMSSPTLTMRVNEIGMIVGTAAYMSPEQARGQPVDKRADIWAFGIVLWEMLTGKRMFAGETISDVLAAVLTKTPDLNRVPVQVRRLLAQCLEKDPKRRLRDIGDVWGLLEELPEATSRSHWARIAATAVLVLAIPATWVLKPQPKQPEQPLLQLEISAPEGATFGLAANHSQFALSPDGGRLVFLATGKDGKRMLWMRLLAADSAAVLAGTENAAAPFWSPDSRAVGFFASGGTLQKIDVAGGRPQVICPTGGGSAGRGTWNSEGVIVFAESQKPLRRVLATGGTPTPVLELDAGRVETQQGAPHFLPDGQHFLYSSYGKETGIAFGSLDGKTHRFLFPQSGHPVASYVPSPLSGGWLMYSVDSQLLARPFDPGRGEFAGEAAIVAPLDGGMSWSASANGLLSFRRLYSSQSQLTWFNRDGKRLGIAGDPGNLSAPRISPDQKTIVFSRGDGRNSDLVLFDIQLKTTNRLTLEPGIKVNPTWSSDGSRIFYASRRQNDNVLVDGPANGIGQEAILKSAPASQFMPNGVSRDGWLVVSELTGVGSRLVLLSPERKTVQFPAQPLANRGFFSPDGRWMLYSSNQAGRFEVFVQSLPKEVGGSSEAVGTFQISPAGGLFGVWRGNEIFYLAPDAKMMAVRVESGTTSFRWETPRPLFQTGLNAGAGNREYDVTPDGQRILINQPTADSSDSPITVMVNWPKVLQK
jgi:Tol biopolymer transport system component/predicted Ser/Thr protein kinase